MTLPFKRKERRDGVFVSCIERECEVNIQLTPKRNSRKMEELRTTSKRDERTNGREYPAIVLYDPFKGRMRNIWHLYINRM